MTRAPGFRRSIWAAATLLFCAAPVPGDIGSCGQPVQELDAERFFASKRTIDCRQCRHCRFETESCDRACDRSISTTASFPAGCLPLVHDGEVCLRALLDAACDEYAGYISDETATVPTECDFCPPPRP